MARGHSPIALDLGGRVVRAVQVDRGGEPVAALTLLRDEPGAAMDDRECERLADALARQGFRGNRVVATAPKRWLRLTGLELPPDDSGAPVHAIARGEAERLCGYEPGSFEMCWWAMPRQSRGVQRAVGVTMPHGPATGLLDALARAGLECERLVPPSFAAAKAAATPRGMDAAAVQAVLDLGWTNATLVICREGRVLFERSTPAAGWGRLIESVAKDMGLSPVDAEWALREGRGERGPVAAAVATAAQAFARTLAEELASSLAYARQFTSEGEPALLTPVGGPADDDEVPDWLEAATGLLVVPTGAMQRRGPTGLGGPGESACVLALARWANGSATSRGAAA